MHRQTSVRLAAEDMARLEAIRQRLMTDIGVRVSRAEVLRLALGAYAAIILGQDDQAARAAYPPSQYTPQPTA